MKKDYIDRIYELIGKEDVELIKLVNRLVEERNCFKELITHDELTNLNNRRVLSNDLDYDIVIMCDIDNFKSINDTFGHIVGDKVLILVSEKLNCMTGNDDLVCRYGGDEFALILNRCTMDEAIVKIKNIRNAIKKVMKNFNLNVTISFGVAEYTKNKSLEDAIDEADKALYASKENGKDAITEYTKGQLLKIKK